jgi:hypothetical protein
MGEIFLGRVRGPRKFERPVAMKRILPHLAADPATLNMFVAEARIAARIRHARVVQVHELVDIDGAYFLVMEYVDGESVGGLMRRLWLRGESLARVLGAHIIAEACAGLHAAHEISDTGGTSLGIVHRDVSPQNVMVTYAGEVKVLDFGIAKGRDAEHTKTGQVKGKCEYMSPEQCRGETLDRRSDIFSLGILLYELTVGRRLFKRDNALLAFAAICDAPIPQPRDVDQEYPQILERICARALARDRRDRYTTALEMRRDLMTAIRCMAGAEDRVGEEELLADLMPELFSDRMREKRELLRQAGPRGTATDRPLAEVDANVELLELGRESCVEATPEPAPRLASVSLHRRLMIAAIAVAAPIVGEAALRAARANPPAALLPGAFQEASPHCPCLPRQTCQIELNRCIELSSGPTPTHGSILFEGRLYSSNESEPVYSSPMVSTEIVNHLTTTYSWFRCWKPGEPHDEGTLWYYTRGDHNYSEGWVRGDRVNAPMAFEANPAAFGFKRCDAQ